MNEGVEYIFGIPGEENLVFLDSLSISSIKLILTRHEQAAGFMAATYGRLTGKAGVCLSTLGPGATNLVTAAAYANLGAMPMVMITGQKPIKSSKQGRFQIVDVVEKPPFFMVSSGRTVIHVNFTSAEVDPVYFPQVEVIGDIAYSIWKIGEALPEQCYRDYSFSDSILRILILSNMLRLAKRSDNGSGQPPSSTPLWRTLSMPAVST